MNPQCHIAAKVTCYFCFLLMMVNCCSCYITKTYSACPWFPELATTVKVTIPIFRCDFLLFTAKVIQVYSRLPHTWRGNQLSLVNETNNDSIIFIYTKLFTESALHSARGHGFVLWFKSHFFDVQNYVSVRSQIW